MTLQAILLRLRNLFHCRSGVSALEFAFALPVLGAVVLGTIDFGRLYYQKHGLERAVSRAARYAHINNTVADSAIISRVRSEALGLNRPNIGVAVAHETVGATRYVVITATYSFQFVTPLIGTGSYQLSSRDRVPRPT
jgi:Flp pilus assembly protein TadG